MTQEAPIVSDALIERLMFDQGLEPSFAWTYGVAHARVITLWNHAAEQLYGVPRAQALGRDPRELLQTSSRGSFAYGPVRLDKTLKHIDRALASEGQWRGELTQHTSSGEPLYVDTAMKVVTLPDGSRMVLETGRDMTQQRRHESLVHDTEKRLRIALRAGRTGIWEHHLDSNEVFWSPETFAVLGIEPFERAVVVEDFARLVHPEDSGRLWSEVQRTIDTEVPMEVEFRIVRPDGEIRWIQDCGVVSHHLGGAPCLVGTVRDITVERELARAVSASEARYRELANAMPHIVWRCGPDGAPDWINERWSEYTGATLESVAGLMTYIHPDDQALTWERWQTSARERSVAELEYRLRRHDGQYRWHLGRVLPILDESGELKSWVAASTDIDDRKRAEESLRDAARRKDEFLAVLSHELRNPLAPILTAVQLMKLHGDVPAPREREAIERQAGHLVRLVDDLLDVSRVAQGKVDLRKRVLPLYGVVAKALEITGPLIEQKHHALTVEVAQHGLYVDADEIRLIQVITNLLTNAARYTPQGGRLLIAAAHEGDQVVLRVRDNGVGISGELLPRIFELFVQGPRGPDRAEGGLGLGLGLVASLTALHGGSVEAHSGGPGLGSEFVLRLPAAAKPKHVDAAPIVSDDSAIMRRSTGRKILVVDDNYDAADLLARAFRRHGHCVEVAHDPAAALSLVEGFTPEIAILDIGLPVMDGYQLARELRAKVGDEMHLLALSGYAQERDMRRSLEAGFARHLVKPADIDLLLQEITRFESKRPPG